MFVVMGDFLSCTERSDMSYLWIEFFKRFGEQKIDIVLDDDSFDSVFNRLVMQKAQQL